MQRCACNIISCNLVHGGCVALSEFEVFFVELVEKLTFLVEKLTFLVEKLTFFHSLQLNF